jgi:predicted amidohydrolase YtcJ
LADQLPRQPVDYRRIGTEAAAWGVTGFTDATPDQTGEDLAGLVAASEKGLLPQRLHLMAPLGAPALDGEKVTLGPVKVMLDDHTLPSLDQLTDAVRGARHDGRAVAVHCVTLVQATLALAAFEAAGRPHRAGPDRVEHGAVLSPGLIDALRRLGITVVTQPGFVATRGDQYRTDVDPDEQADLWRCASLLDAGVALAAGTDAPFGPANPWTAVRAASDRRTEDGHVLGPAERVPSEAAVSLWSGHAARPGRRRVIGPGEPADLCVLAEPAPPAPALATIVAGEVVHRIS